MGTGIRAEVKIDTPAECPIAQLSAATETSSYSITKSVSPTDPTRVTEEFMLDAELSLESLADDSELELDLGPELEEGLTEVFSYGSKTVYRFTRERGRGCPCECLAEFDCPIVDVHIESGALYLVFHATDMAGLQEIIGELRERYPNLDVQRLLQSQQDRTEQNLVFVDRSTLTDRQREVLETAHRMGYFDHPKRANAGEVASELEITTSTFTEHLSAAQTKILSAILTS
ncbi:helix-turn-helix domain-containing protein [Halobacteria archaeon AArc-m2/3/4]|uniref:Helix-turn-helix domain-containing protein n=1 Tax=Natronoglomus mannanivorans TaxID=2979990 RepID=A0AAP2Z415_9EURY|nr:helix-turn-helix domain-containing protein [Halobacteria archaeon AArc-xg1-1]MCU4975250.1 helix-turn-helix domain-containing protein [Halobacteria archaeon AArc-m2/3/4]